MAKRKLEEEVGESELTIDSLMASIEHLEQLIKSLEANLLNKIEELGSTSVVERETISELAGSSFTNSASAGGVGQASYVAPQWRQYVNEKLGNDFGLDAEYSANGGFNITIIVPLDKSNASKDYLEMHKVDRRTKAINPVLGFEGVKQFVDLVAKNLNIKK